MLKSQTKHTQGPWVFDDTWGLIMADNGATEIAACHAGRGADAKANARLIASAPELLMIARAYCNHLKTSAQADSEVATYEHIKSVIAKATGEV